MPGADAELSDELQSVLSHRYLLEFVIERCSDVAPRFVGCVFHCIGFTRKFTIPLVSYTLIYLLYYSHCSVVMENILQGVSEIFLDYNAYLYCVQQ